MAGDKAPGPRSAGLAEHRLHDGDTVLEEAAAQVRDGGRSRTRYAGGAGAAADFARPKIQFGLAFTFGSRAIWL